MVPQWTTEKRTIQTTEYRQEQKERTITVYERVPKIVTRTCNYTVYERENRSRQETYTVCRPVTKHVEQTYTVCVPHTETRTAMRTVCKPVSKSVEQTYTVNVPYAETRKATRKVWKCVPVTKTYKVCEDQGAWEQRTHHVSTACNVSAGECRGDSCCPASCDPCVRQTACTTRVWVPKIVEREIEYTAYERQAHDEEYEYQVTLCKPETRTRTIQVCQFEQAEEEYQCQQTVWKNEQRTRTVEVCDWITEEKTRTVNDTVCVPKTKTREYEVTVYECVPRQKTVTYTVCMPHTVDKEIEVRVCKMVPKTITEQVHTECQLTACEVRRDACCR